MKKHHSTFLLIISLIFLCFKFNSCDLNQNDSNNLELRPIKELNLNNGINCHFSDIYCDDDKEYLLLFDYVSLKKISFINLATEQIEFETQLDTVIKQCGNIGSIDVLSPDTILVLGEAINHIFFLNRKGDIWKTLDLNPFMQEFGYYELSKGHDPFISDANTLLFKCSYSHLNDTFAFWHNGKAWLEQASKAPYLLKVKNFYDNRPSISFGVNGFYRQFSTPDHITQEGGHFISTDSSIFISSIFVDTIYEYKKQNLNIKQKHFVKSEYTSLGYTPATYEEIVQDDNYANSLGQTSGVISQVVYDSYRQLFYILALHKIPLETTQKERIRPWSILIYNNQFTLLDEIKMDQTKYRPQLLVTKGGLLISNYYAKQNDKDIFNKTTFELFELIEK